MGCRRVLWAAGSLRAYSLGRPSSAPELSELSKTGPQLRPSAAETVNGRDVSDSDAAGLRHSSPREKVSTPTRSWSSRAVGPNQGAQEFGDVDRGERSQKETESLMYELSIRSDREPLGNPPDMPPFPLLARPGSDQVGVLEAAFIDQVRDRINVDPEVLDNMVLSFERERRGADSLVVRCRLYGDRELVRLPVFGYSPAREVLGDASQVAAYITAMWEMLIFGWEQHTARNVKRVQQTIASKLKRLWDSDPATLLDACETVYPPHKLWDKVLPSPWVPTHAPYWDTYQQLTHRAVTGHS